jgi:putative oxidoreductase
MEMETEVRRNYSMILIRVLMGLVFLLEGILKFLRPEELGAGRFEALGLPYPHFLAPFVGGIEIAGGAAILLNLYAGDAAFVLLLVIITALVTTKFTILLGRPLGPFPLEKLTEYGWLSFFHQARTDLCMVFGLLAIVIDSGLKVGKKRRWYQTGPN